MTHSIASRTGLRFRWKNQAIDLAGLGGHGELGERLDGRLLRRGRPALDVDLDDREDPTLDLGEEPGWSSRLVAGPLEDLVPGLGAIPRGHRPAWRAGVEGVGRVGIRGEPIDQAERSRPEVADRPAGEQQVERLAAVDDPGEPGDPAPGGDQAEVDLGQAGLQGRGRGQRHAAAAGQRQLQPAAQAGAVDHRDGRDRQRRQPVDRP